MPITKRIVDKVINFRAITSLYSENSMTLTYTDSTGGDIDVMTLSDGITTKTLQFLYDGEGRCIGFDTTITEV